MATGLEQLKRSVHKPDRFVHERVLTFSQVFENGFVETKHGRYYRIAEMGGLLEVGRNVEVCADFSTPWQRILILCK